MRDTILDVSVELLTRAQGDGAGVYLRQTSERRFVSWVVSHDRRCQIAITDEAPMPVIDAALGPDLVLHLDRPNRMTVVAIGPSLTFVLNGNIVAGVPVDHRYLEGYAGMLVYGGGPEPSEAAVDWIAADRLGLRLGDRIDVILNPAALYDLGDRTAAGGLRSQIVDELGPLGGVLASFGHRHVPRSLLVACRLDELVHCHHVVPRHQLFQRADFFV